MWGLSIYLMQLADYLRGRKNKVNCKLCGKTFKDGNQLESHTRNEHK